MPSPESFPQSSKIPKALPLQKLSNPEFRSLTRSEQDKAIESTAAEILKVFRSSGAIEYNNIGKMHQALSGVQMIVRREDPEKVIQTIEHHEPLEISLPENRKYSNAVLWDASLGSKGLENAYLEGYSHTNGVVTVLGIKQRDSHTVVALPDATQQFAGFDRSHVRSVEGIVQPEDILFVALRIPVAGFPVVDMTEGEFEKYQESLDSKGRTPVFIHRGFLFVDHIKKQ